MLLTLFDGSGRQLATANPTSLFDAAVAQPASLTYSVPAAGRYYISVAKTGYGTPGTSAYYSTYGSAGQYAVAIVGADSEVRSPSPPPTPPRPPPPRPPLPSPASPVTVTRFASTSCMVGATGTPVVNSHGDDASQPITISFPFAFDGRYYHKGLNGGVHIGSNG